MTAEPKAEIDDTEKAEIPNKRQQLTASYVHALDLCCDLIATNAIFALCPKCLVAVRRQPLICSKTNLLLSNTQILRRRCCLFVPGILVKRHNV